MTSSTTSCSHGGVNAGYPWIQGLCGPVCAHCNTTWPGHQLPKPEPGRNDGYGEHGPGARDRGGER